MSIKRNYGESVQQESAGFAAERLVRLKELFPEIFTEGNKIDSDKLRILLGDTIDERPERYAFSWAGKREALRLLQIPSRATLIPAPKESVKFENTRNLFIEGENLEVLKLLYKSYFGRVKIIYLDPPYNTGNDFIYPDNYRDPLDTYLRMSGQKDEQGNLLTSKPNKNGHIHSSWLSMMYPRLFLARQLLHDDGIILVSIDDHEVHNLRLAMNELFGEENFIAQLVWEKGRKNDAKLFSVGHEYMLVYARSVSTLKEHGTIWREPKPGAQEIWDEYLRLRQVHGADDAAIEIALQDWYRALPDAHPSKKLSRYKHVDKWGPWRDRDISWPGGGGPRYDVIHPDTNQPCTVPESGWRFAAPETMERQIKLGLVVFREDHLLPPFRKAHLRPIPDELDDDSEMPFDENGQNGQEEEESTAVGMQVMPSYIYKQSQVAVKYLRGLMGVKLFDNPKDHEILARLIRYIAGDDEQAIVLDFFAGSSSTAEAILQLNRQFKTHLQFILVQIPEVTSEKSTARKAGYQTIAEIGKDRIRRVIAKMTETRTAESEDLGFKVFKLAESNFRSWTGVEKADPKAYLKQVQLFVDPLREGWNPEQLIFEVAIREGFDLGCRIKKVEQVKANTVFEVRSAEKDQSFYICLDKVVTLDALAPLSLSREAMFVCRDMALSDETAANLALQCRLKTI